MTMTKHVGKPAARPSTRLVHAFAASEGPSNAVQTITTTSFLSEGTLTPDSQDSQLARMADAYSALSHGALLQICQGNLSVEQPVLQCVQIKPMNNANQTGPERWRVVMSDSINFMQGMLGQREWKD